MARIGCELTETFRIWVDGFNLLNAKASQIDYFYVSRLRGEPAAGVGDIHFHPADPALVPGHAQRGVLTRPKGGPVVVRRPLVLDAAERMVEAYGC